MEYHGWPFRKYAREEEQIGDWCVVVPDQTTDEEVFAMAVERGLDTSKWMDGKAKGMYGKGGKGFFESKDEIPTDEEKKAIENVKKGK